MKNRLHILNGDGLHPTVLEAGIQGDFMIWREALSRGPAQGEFGSEDFFKQRAQFLLGAYPGHTQTYHETFLLEWEKLYDYTSYDEIVCWFGQDYFCQINLYALLHWLSDKNILPALSLVCTDKNSKGEKITCLGHLGPKELGQEFNKRTKLDSHDLEAANLFWEAYSAPDALVFNALNISSKNLVFLSKTIQLHIQLFPNKKTGLNRPENMILDQINGQRLTRRQLIGKTLQKDVDHGFGDLQWETFLSGIESLLGPQPDDSFSFPEHKPETFSRKIEDHIWNGGALMKDFVEHQGKLFRNSAS